MIARIIAQQAVDRFEMIQINVQNRNAPLITQSVGKRHHTFVQAVAIKQTRERISPYGFFQKRLLRLARRDINSQPDTPAFIAAADSP